jgi:citrate synthase
MLTTKQAADRLGLKPQSVIAFIKRGKIAGRKVGRDWIISVEEVERYANAPKARGGRPKKER